MTSGPEASTSGVLPALRKPTAKATVNSTPARGAHRSERTWLVVGARLRPSAVRAARVSCVDICPPRAVGHGAPGRYPGGYRVGIRAVSAALTWGIWGPTML